MAEDRYTSDRPARPLPECLTRLLIQPGAQVKRIDDPLVEFCKPTLFDRALWWFSIAMFGSAAFIFSATLTVRMLQ
ncbi:hypothetical protein ACRAWG_21910 [Methylobacterium sp. P31]